MQNKPFISTIAKTQPSTPGKSANHEQVAKDHTSNPLPHVHAGVKEYL